MCKSILSRKVWVRLLKTKTGEEVLLNLQSILNETGKVEEINSDRGDEWVNKKAKKFLSDRGILLKHPFTFPHSPHVERVQSTLQNLIFKCITKSMNFRFIDKLQDIVKTYNNRKHTSTKLSPNDGEKKENSLHIQKMHENYYNKIKPTKKIRFKVGDMVRIAVSKEKFGRGYDKKANEEIYKVVKVIKKFPRVLYQIATLDGEDNVIGFFYQEQITKVIDQD